ncbi:MAG: hypothetical protein BGO55_17550 [Sphingobacteriales bacterium 50-39]|nr:hypothetical protein [Sphingobacteriales bacterium]OJW59862.1 MAG: hypothetical protein BGO55_17550 [Sphingobacteriales bacterium 50-39]
MRDKRFAEITGRFVDKAIKNKELVVTPFEVYWSIAFAPLSLVLKALKPDENESAETRLSTQGV